MIPKTIYSVGRRSARPYLAPLAATQPDAYRRAGAASAQAVAAVQPVALPYCTSQVRRDSGYCATIQYSQCPAAVTAFAQQFGAEVTMTEIETRPGWSALDAHAHIGGVPVHAWTEIPTPAADTDTIGAGQ
ncbi:hypothetical protein ACFVWX_29125 [Streptomyces sp. NPDC058220]|uniref:hypothetical protein n=1 Tax=Streptomyces sp. NPDC058220 TaxID=3346387 RepID=UPI0036E48B0D